MDGWMNGWMDVGMWVCRYGCMDVWMYVWLYGCMCNYMACMHVGTSYVRQTPMFVCVIYIYMYKYIYNIYINVYVKSCHVSVQFPLEFQFNLQLFMFSCQNEVATKPGPNSFNNPQAPPGKLTWFCPKKLVMEASFHGDDKMWGYNGIHNPCFDIYIT